MALFKIRYLHPVKSKLCAICRKGNYINSMDQSSYFWKAGFVKIFDDLARKKIAVIEHKAIRLQTRTMQIAAFVQSRGFKSGWPLV